MRNVIMMCMMVFPCNIFVFGQESSTDSEKQRNAQADLVYNQIQNKSIPLEQILSNFKKLKSMSHGDSLSLIRSMRYIVAALSFRFEDENAAALELEQKIVAQYAFLPLDKSFNIFQRCETLYDQLTMIQTQDYRRCKLLGYFNDCDPKLREKNSDRLIELYQLIITQIDKDYDPNAKENIWMIDGFIPPPSYTGGYASGMDFSNVEDAATRDAYKKYVEEINEKSNKQWAYNIVSEVRDYSTKPVQEYLIDAYTLFPYRTAELKQMLTDHKVAPEMAKTILDAVRKVEKEHPDKGFRIWLSKDKLLKTEAKFIFYDAKIKEATLEREDGKRMSIEWSALRKEDQEYIRRQIELDQKKLKD